MNEETSMKDGPGTGEAAGLDAQGAAVIAQRLGAQSSRSELICSPQQSQHPAEGRGEPCAAARESAAAQALVLVFSGDLHNKSTP